MNETQSYSLSLSFENVSLPPFEDILVLTQKSPHGKIGITGSLNLLQPDQFEVIEVDDEVVEALIVNQRILKRINASAVIDILKKRVFPYIVKGEIVKVDFRLRIYYENLTVDMDYRDEGRLSG